LTFYETINVGMMERQDMRVILFFGGLILDFSQYSNIPAFHYSISLSLGDFIHPVSARI
jgi:hypothetical protein